jgi:hypothetical protein
MKANEILVMAAVFVLLSPRPVWGRLSPQFNKQGRDRKA